MIRPLSLATSALAGGIGLAAIGYGFHIRAPAIEHTVSFYVANPAQLAQKTSWCQDHLGQAAGDVDCLNAQAANAKVGLEAFLRADPQAKLR